MIVCIMVAKNQSQHILELSRDLLDDIELDRLPADKLLLKASRLARLVGREEILNWIALEMGGYNATDPISIKYMTLTSRWTNFSKKEGYFGPSPSRTLASPRSKQS